MLERQFIKLDAAESVFFLRQLEEIAAKSYDIKYENLKALTFLPVNTSLGAATETYTYRTYDQTGTAKLIKSYAKDFPRADVSGAEFTSHIKSFGASYGYNVQEIRKAQATGIPLEQRKANAARRAIEQFHESMAKLAQDADGTAVPGLLGFLNQPNALVKTLPADGTGATTTWSTKTPDQMVRDMHVTANFIVEQTKDIEKPDTLLLPLTAFHTAMTTRIGSTDGSFSTVLSCFLANNQYIKTVASWTQLETAGASNTRRMVAYRRDPDALEYLAPILMESFPAQEEMMEFVVPVHARSGGVVAYYPLTIAYSDAF